ncbi:acyl-CoA Delta(11) desaturase isoform X2 [Copidosoma floridanum]|nr:acyl-CoA Delta(11) desaturase isoform X2 [Copidosoma floridanum]XP_014207852.1 acyl-CoA Delta(11) desaturase isoform X2 [Copidosoma floridanum]XP_014207860.1 acyl-CoA Delta(11) desaturase isoform X2 [Copidosoma floridanum]
MAPNVTSSSPTGVLFENDSLAEEEAQNDKTETIVPAASSAQTEYKYKRQLVWRNIILFASLHIGALYGVWLIFTSAKISTTLFAIFLYEISALGITAGAHRLWSHRSYKAKWPLRLILVFFNTIAFQDAAIDWARDHRLHHKYSETDADPHNAKRGFFFCHIGWLLCRKHPAVKEKGKGIDLSDLYSDPILVFQKKYYLILMPIFCFVLPTVIPIYFWNETFVNALYIPTLLRYAFTLNITWLVNSVAHLFGNKPYDRFMNPAQNLSVALLALGEGWHNYHHTFPWDYKTAELGDYWYNFTTMFIDFFAKIGWAYDLKTVSRDMVKKRVQRTGDGSHELWGWGDKDQLQDERDDVLVTHKHKD